jgi:phospholipid transport system substrate-binding protein
MNYRMRDRDGEWYAIDVVIEGVSMIANFRSQVQEIVSQRGADGLIEALREKNDRDSPQGSS